MDGAPAFRELGPGDFVLRRIHRNHVKPPLSPSIERPAFCPNDKDDTGISVYDASIVTPEALVGVKSEPGNYYVARLSVATLLGLRLSFRPEEDVVDHLPGHYVIPELRYEELLRAAKSSKELQRELARLASSDIVLRPPDA